MNRPPPIGDAELQAWLSTHSAWRNESGALTRAFAFPDFGTALAFVVRIGLAAEKRDHHPDLELAWGRVRVRWTTHDAKGITALDLELAETTESLLENGKVER